MSLVWVLSLAFGPIAQAQDEHSPQRVDNVGGEAQPQTPMSVRIIAREDLRVGDRSMLEVEVSNPGSGPLMLTPQSEGEALEVVVGRLLRADGRARGDRWLFRVPIIAQSAGIAIVTVRLLSYACTTGACQPTILEARLVLQVGPAPSLRGGPSAQPSPGTL